MPGSTQSVQGYKLMEEHFPAGELAPIYLLIESPGGSITDLESLQSINEIAQSLQNVSGISRVDYYSAPSSQLSGLAVQVRGIGDEIGQGNGIGNISILQTAGKNLQELALQYPGIVQSRNFEQIQTSLVAVSALSGQISTADPASLPSILAQLKTNI
jgi:uncharacterized membrane protein YdfJ with MMPL/SSD domain